MPDRIDIGSSATGVLGAEPSVKRYMDQGSPRGLRACRSPATEPAGRVHPHRTYRAIVSAPYDRHLFPASFRPLLDDSSESTISTKSRAAYLPCQPVCQGDRRYRSVFSVPDPSVPFRERRPAGDVRVASCGSAHSPNPPYSDNATCSPSMMAECARRGARTSPTRCVSIPLPDSAFQSSSSGR